jgi:hypothetical protein
MNYVTASIEEVSNHLKSATRQLVFLTKERYRDNPDMLLKIEKAIILGKIARLQDELDALEKQAQVHTKTDENPLPEPLLRGLHACCVP